MTYYMSSGMLNPTHSLTVPALKIYRRHQRIRCSIASQKDYRLVLTGNYCSEPVDYEDFDGGDTSIDLRAYHVVGGVVHFNLLQMPPQPKVIRGWTITQCMFLVSILIFSFCVSSFNIRRCLDAV